MIEALIERVLRYRVLIGVAVLVAIVLSVIAVRNAPLDAIPDTSDPQVVVYAKWSRSPQLLESQITEPIVKAMGGLTDVRGVRGASHMGYAFIYVVLKEGANRSAVQQQVVDKLNTIRPQLPSDAVVTLGPNASSMGWIYQYALVDRDKNLDLRDLRLLNDRQVKPALEATPGVAEVASVGGLEKQFQLKIFPPLLAQSGLNLQQVVGTLQRSFQEAGGRTIEVTNRDYQVRGVINTDSIDSLELAVLGRDKAGKAVRLKDIGYIQVGYDQRRGIAELNGEGEVVGGIVIMAQKQNAIEVTRALKARMAALSATLPPGVKLVPTYDRSDLIWGTLKHFFLTLAYELLVVIGVTVLFLRNLRTAVAPVAILLLGTLFTALPLWFFHQTINLFSLAGLFIAIGEMVDATIVIVENCTAELAARGKVSAEERRKILLRSIAKVGRPLLFSLLIILASFLPVFFLGDKEGRLFDPLAWSKTSAMAFSTLLTLVVLPIIIVWIFKREHIQAPTKVEFRLVAGYRRAVTAVIKHRYLFLGANLVVLLVAIFVFAGFKKDYMPQMEEGAVLYMPSTLPGLPAREAGWILQQIDAKLKAFPEVDSVFGKLGRADTATDSAPVSMVEATVRLKPANKWRKGMTKAKLVADMDKAMQIPGYVNTWVQPISARVMMQDTGIQTPVGLKIKGANVAVVEDLGRQIESALTTFKGTQSVIAERISSGYFVDVRFDAVRMADQGVTADEAMATVRYAVEGDNIVAIPSADGAAIPLNVQYAPEYIDTLAKIRGAPVITEGGRTLPLSDIAEVGVNKLPEMIRNDGGMLTSYVFINVKDVTATDYVGKAKPFLANAVALPAGYAVEWTGDYENAAKARKQLVLIIPLTLVIIFGLLLLAFRSLADTALIMLSVPFALVGGVFLQALMGYPMTTAVIIGYIALFAVAIQTGIIMIVFIRQALSRREGEGGYVEAVLDGSVLRLRPKLMTVAATTLSLLPIMVSSGPGMEMMKPIATPTVGGMISSTLYVLFLIPCLFAIGEDLRKRWRQRAQ